MVPTSLADRRIVVLPDLYVDALVPLPTWQETRPHLDQIASRGGGNLPVGPIDLRLGGNAANLALGLARLGAHVDLIAMTDPVGAHLLKTSAHGLPLETDRVRVGARTAMTVGLECQDANVMLSDAGPVADFGPGHLEEEDLRRIAAADAVAVVNWAQNQEGTALLAAVSDHVHEDAFLYVDTGDPRHRHDEAQALVADDTVWVRVDAWGLNENELGAFTDDAAGDPVAVAHGLSRRLGVRLDLHTRHWAASIDGDEVVRVEAEPSPAVRLTGAGDAWNAGNIAGRLLGHKPEDRLRLAHQVATEHVTRGDAPVPHPVSSRRRGTKVNP